MSEENFSDPMNNRDEHSEPCNDYEQGECEGDFDEDVSDIKTPLLLDNAVKTPRSACKDLVFQFPCPTPRSILKSTNNNLVRRAAKTKMRTFLTVPGASVSTSSGQESSSKCPASTPLPLSVLGKINTYTHSHSLQRQFSSFSLGKLDGFAFGQ